MKNSIKTELSSHVLDLINDNVITDENFDERHFYAFNQDYYLIGYFQCNEWLKKHNIDTFEAIEIVKDYEIEHFGEFTTSVNSEAIVNMVAYIYGEELLQEFRYSDIEELKYELEVILSL